MISVDVALKLGAFELDVAFASDAGVTALFGRSGAGKSMTISLIAGLMRPRVRQAFESSNEQRATSNEPDPNISSVND